MYNINDRLKRGIKHVTKISPHDHQNSVKQLVDSNLNESNFVFDSIIYRPWNDCTLTYLALNIKFQQ